ncbi:hypothetical protein Pyn_19516 [Prunus yedoensis var. nudiflora]|uniref:Uncharacterized protein n=1 Tax=Prunus yedoensis var. nudiflora TaxID=2094558 RepID=A0A314UF26_PRUYE|nr:hypothetical protein Pyn_19516 [Prunus yedoensis var. nudiflora]
MPTPQALGVPFHGFQFWVSHLKLNQFTFMGSHLYFEDLINRILSPTDSETNLQNGKSLIKHVYHPCKEHQYGNIISSY